MNEPCPQAIATITKSRSRHDPYWVLLIEECPFCGGRHVHGGGSLEGPPALGERLSHCRDDPRTYTLIARGDREGGQCGHDD